MTLVAIITMVITTTAMTETTLAPLRLWQLISPTLPIGAFAYSAGLEYAVEAGWVRDEAGAGEWIWGQLEETLSQLELPLLQRFYAAWQTDDAVAIADWSTFLQASREAPELLAEDRQLGMALARVLTNLGISEAEAWQEAETASFVNLFALAGSRWQIPLETLAAGFLWAWAENQVAAAVKLVPLGQSAGQRLLFAAARRIPTAVATGLALADEEIGAGAFGMALASARHETQYSRLFRS
ncbi:MAG TPA: urease accessory UreF family protein [Gammaproteobacteria bacterium]|nr:urease accessory UreF family protein [Gammaproteobacteria bacterium]